jgi:hypothetical protein
MVYLLFILYYFIPNVMTPGLYAFMAIMTFYFLLNRPKRMAGRQITLYYTTFMAIIAFPSFITSLKTLEAGVVEVPAGTPEAYDGYYCSPIYIANSVVSTLQFLASDALLVRVTSINSGLFLIEIKQVYRAYTFFEGSWRAIAGPIAIYSGLVGT